MLHLETLNERQKEAVLATDGPVLIVAGAGAGKTKTITHRIAHMIEKGVPSSAILAVTFTNKAAKEMRERVEKLLQARRGASPLITTFHSLGVRILREFHAEARIERGFSIWDRDDSIRAIKKVLESIGQEWKPSVLLSAISREKGNGVSVSEYQPHVHSRFEQGVATVWKLYEVELAKEGALDFDDLLLRTQRLLEASQKTRELLQARWAHITIDEYQDTNRSQFEIARLLAGERRNLCVVGDTDQCLVAGTKIAMADGQEKTIERVKKGDEILSSYGSGDLRGARVTDIFRRVTDRGLTQITTSAGRVVMSTPEHIHFAGYKLGKTPQLYFTYLMHKRGKGYRLGTSQVYTNGQKKPMVGFQQRCNQEHADCVWIIGTHKTPVEARVHEYTLSMQYQIPTLPFVARRGTSTNGYVHDQQLLDKIFKACDTEQAGVRLLGAYGLSLGYPHHRAQSAGDRRNVVITLCGDRRGKTAMHRISIAVDESGKRALETAGFSVRPARESTHWRFESAHKDFRTIHEIVSKIQSVLPHVAPVEVARLGRNRLHANGNSLPFLPAASVLPGMVMFDQGGGYDTVEGIEKIHKKAVVYDLNIEGTHNFIANGILTHNSIYSWRGADMKHLLAFERAFPGTKVVLLEQNYRSTRTILAAANAIVAKNVFRAPKNLFTENATGEPLALYAARNEGDEAWFVAETVAHLIDSGTQASEIAVLYRENFQSRAIEESFLATGLPYQVLGTKFFERKEVKDVLSYLRLAINPKARLDLARAVGVPPRGIGAVTLAKMVAGEDGSLSMSARTKVSAFRESLRLIEHAVRTLPASEAILFVLEKSGMEKMLRDEKREAEKPTADVYARWENVRELVNLASRYDFAAPPEGIEKLLEEAALMSDQDSHDKEEGVSLMTVHASKGLEFDAVFITGLEQGLFPEVREGDSRDPEEERRLFYVALTRARHRVFLSYASERSKWGKREMTLPSEFLGDIDSRLISYAIPGKSNGEAETIIR